MVYNYLLQYVKQRNSLCGEKNPMDPFVVTIFMLPSMKGSNHEQGFLQSY